MATEGPTLETPRQHSGWLILLGFLLALLAAVAAFLAYYLAPRPQPYRADQIVPTLDTGAVALSVHGAKLEVPANYLPFPRNREGGEQKTLALFALWPRMDGYASWQSALFTGNAPDSPLVYMQLREDPTNLSPAARLSRIYMPYVVSDEGQPDKYGLTRYAFRDDSGYRNQDLFTGEAATGTVILLCARPGPQLRSPNCLATDDMIAPSVGLSYRFKRAHLEHWQDITAGVRRLVTGFRRQS